MSEFREFRNPGATAGLVLLSAVSLWACDGEPAREVIPPGRLALPTFIPDASSHLDFGTAPDLSTLPSAGPGASDSGSPSYGTAPSEANPEAGPSTAPPSEAPLLRTEPETVSEALIRHILERRREPLSIEHLLSRGEVRQVTGYLNGLAPVALEGRAPDEHYNALRYATEGSFGFALQVWEFGDADEATQFFERLEETYIVTGTTRVAGDSAFRAELGGIRQIVFVSRSDHKVVAVSCDVGVCPDETVVQELAQRIHQRL